MKSLLSIAIILLSLSNMALSWDFKTEVFFIEEPLSVYGEFRQEYTLPDMADYINYFYYINKVA